MYFVSPSYSLFGWLVLVSSERSTAGWLLVAGLF
jgi:hypothetical protein